MTVAEMRQRMSTYEFAQWIALYRIEAREREAEQRKQAATARTRRHR